ncbi:MAG: hypothetical protein KDI68_00675 [Gammaproteobacteria bacterium]|nr:hypothetical protein [Gammaproteobacteria bacterium]
MKLYELLDRPDLIGPVCIALILWPAISDAEQANRYRPIANSMMEMMDAFSSAFRERGSQYTDQAGGGMPWSSTPWNMNSTPMSPGISPWSMSGMPLGSALSPWSIGGMPMSPSMSPWSMGGMPTPQSFNPWQWSGNPTRQHSFGVPASGSGTPLPWWPSATTNPLQGRWIDPQGHQLEVAGERFTIARSPNSSSGGRIQIGDQHMLTLYPSGDAQGRRYEYAVQDGKLALRDEQGNLLLFRRVQQP